jgi:hypothetical protein
MLLHIQDDSFDVAVTGFDANRDLYLDVKAKQPDHSDSLPDTTSRQRSGNSAKSVGRKSRTLRKGK